MTQLKYLVSFLLLKVTNFQSKSCVATSVLKKIRDKEAGHLGVVTKSQYQLIWNDGYNEKTGHFNIKYNAKRMEDERSYTFLTSDNPSNHESNINSLAEGFKGNVGDSFKHMMNMLDDKTCIRLRMSDEEELTSLPADQREDLGELHLMDYSAIDGEVRCEASVGRKEVLVAKKDDSIKATISAYKTLKNITRELILHEGCTSKRTYAHEMMHVLGFYHEHEREDRDSYLANIKSHRDCDIKISKLRNHDENGDYSDEDLETFLDNQRTFLDLRSIMMYPSVNKKCPFALTDLAQQQLNIYKNIYTDYVEMDSDGTTKTSKVGKHTIGLENEFSDLDIYNLNAVYGCPSKMIQQKVFTGAVDDLDGDKSLEMTSFEYARCMGQLDVVNMILEFQRSDKSGKNLVNDPYEDMNETEFEEWVRKCNKIRSLYKNTAKLQNNYDLGNVGNKKSVSAYFMRNLNTGSLNHDSTILHSNMDSDDSVNFYRNKFGEYLKEFNDDVDNGSSLSLAHTISHKLNSVIDFNGIMFENLKSITPNLFLNLNDLQEVTFQLLKNLEKVENYSFHYNNKLTKLTIANCAKLASLEKYSLYGKHPDLTEIYLYGNAFQEVPGIFKTFAYPLDWKDSLHSSNSKFNEDVQIWPKLETLDLGFNFIEKIDSKDFEALTNLKKLYLQNNGIKTVGSNFAESRDYYPLSNLQELFIGNNELEKNNNFPKPFQALKKLKIIDLSGNKGNVTDVNICSCPEPFEYDIEIALNMGDDFGEEDLLKLQRPLCEGRKRVYDCDFK